MCNVDCLIHLKSCIQVIYTVSHVISIINQNYNIYTNQTNQTHKAFQSMRKGLDEAQEKTLFLDFFLLKIPVEIFRTLDNSTEEESHFPLETDNVRV